MLKKLKRFIRKGGSSQLVEDEIELNKVVSGEALNDLVKIETIEPDETPGPSK